MKGSVPNWSDEVFVIKKVKNSVPLTNVISDINGEEIVGTFYLKELQKTNRKEFRVEKVIKRKADKLYILYIYIHKKATIILLSVGLQSKDIM